MFIASILRFSRLSIVFGCGDVKSTYIIAQYSRILDEMLVQSELAKIPSTFSSLYSPFSPSFAIVYFSHVCVCSVAFVLINSISPYVVIVDCLSSCPLWFIVRAEIIRPTFVESYLVVTSLCTHSRFLLECIRHSRNCTRTSHI